MAYSFCVVIESAIENSCPAVRLEANHAKWQMVFTSQRECACRGRVVPIIADCLSSKRGQSNGLHVYLFRSRL